MFKSIWCMFTVVVISLACNSNKNFAQIQPRLGTIEIPAKGELRVWDKVEHASFEVILSNPNSSQSCELYRVNKAGVEKWISPSLLANSSLTVSIPINGHLFLKNFNPNSITINYKIND